LTVEEIHCQAGFACIAKRENHDILRYANMPPCIDLIFASTFGMRDFKAFLASKEGKIWGAQEVCQEHAFERVQGLIPRGQILSWLKVQAHFLDVCIHCTSSTVRPVDPVSDLSTWILTVETVLKNFAAASPDFVESKANESSTENFKEQSSSKYWSVLCMTYRISLTTGVCLAGDVVAVIYGSSRPCLLQVNPSEYWVTDEVALDDIEASQLQLQTVEIY
jgi:hypothetical protein